MRKILVIGLPNREGLTLKERGKENPIWRLIFVAPQKFWQKNNVRKELDLLPQSYININRVSYRLLDW